MTVAQGPGLGKPVLGQFQAPHGKHQKSILQVSHSFSFERFRIAVPGCFELPGVRLTTTLEDVVPIRFNSANQCETCLCLR